MNIPKELNEAALIDGATGWQLIRYIQLPLCRASIGTSVIASLTSRIAMYEQIALTTSGGPGDDTMSLPIILVKGIMDYRYGYANAVGVVMFIIGLIVLGVVNKLFRMDEAELLRRRHTMKIKYKPWAKGLMYLVEAVVIILSVFPILWVVMSSFKTNGEILSSPLALPAHFSLDTFIEIFQKYSFPTYFSTRCWRRASRRWFRCCFMPWARMSLPSLSFPVASCCLRCSPSRCLCPATARPSPSSRSS